MDLAGRINISSGYMEGNKDLETEFLSDLMKLDYDRLKRVPSSIQNEMTANPVILTMNIMRRGPRAAKGKGGRLLG